MLSEFMILKVDSKWIQNIDRGNVAYVGIFGRCVDREHAFTVGLIPRIFAILGEKNSVWILDCLIES